MYWIECWQIPLQRHLKVRSICTTRPQNGRFDALFNTKSILGRRETTWGEVTAAYYSSNEAKFMWDLDGPDRFMNQFQPDQHISGAVVQAVAKKVEKYSDIVKKLGKGHLLVVMNAPLTTRSTREMAECKVLEFLKTKKNEQIPFDTFWLAYRMSEIEPVRPEHQSNIYPDESCQQNFFKCIATQIRKKQIPSRTSND